MKKIIFILMILFLFSSCATSRKYQIHNKKRGLMIWENTEMPINKKYYDQKGHKQNKRYKKFKRRNF